MVRYEYKIVALPQTLKLPKRRRRTHEDLVAEAIETILNEQARDGWEYQRADQISAPTKGGLFSKAQDRAAHVLVFRRAATDSVGSAIRDLTPSSQIEAARPAASARPPAQQPTAARPTQPPQPARPPQQQPQPQTPPRPSAPGGYAQRAEAAARPGNLAPQESVRVIDNPTPEQREASRMAESPRPSGHPFARAGATPRQPQPQQPPQPHRPYPSEAAPRPQEHPARGANAPTPNVRRESTQAAYGEGYAQPLGGAPQVGMSVSLDLPPTPDNGSASGEQPLGPAKPR